jgi:outer membrane protein assembly factor BamB
LSCARLPEEKDISKAMRSLIVTVLAAAAAGILTTPALSAEKSLAWPRFRGPNGSGVADGAKPPVELGPDKNVKWKVPAPSGLSSPIIAGDNVVITALEDGKLYTIAYKLKDGKEAWRADAQAKKLEAYMKTEGSPAASTSVTDGKRVVSYFGSCGVIGYNLKGKELWRFDMPTAVTGGEVGSGVSPIIADGMVVLVRDDKKDSKIIALDAATGARKWEQKRLSPASYCTPVIWDTANGKEVVAAGHARMMGYDLKNGAEKWFLNGMPSGCCSSPVAADGTLFFAGGGSSGPDDREMQMPSFDSMLKNLDKDNDGALSREEAETAFRGFFDNQDANKDGKITRDEWDEIIKFMSEGKSSVFALKPGGTGDVTTSGLLWKKTKGFPYIASGLMYRGQYVMVKDGGIVTAYDAKTGAEVYQERAAAAGKYYASPVAANGHIYFTSLDGAVTVLKAGTGKPEAVATNPKLGERTAATPAIVGDVLLLRTDKHLYAFTEKK